MNEKEEDILEKPAISFSRLFVCVSTWKRKRERKSARARRPSRGKKKRRDESLRAEEDKGDVAGRPGYVDGSD
jgi:hypothetical protein